MQHQTGNALSKSFETLTGIAAFIFSILLTPLISDETQYWAIRTFEGLYGPELGGFLSWGWILIVGIAVFFTLRVSFTIALMVLNSWLLMRI